MLTVCSIQIHDMAHKCTYSNVAQWAKIQLVEQWFSSFLIVFFQSKGALMVLWNFKNSSFAFNQFLGRFWLPKKKIVFLILLIPLFSIFSSTVCREIQYYYIHPTNMYKRWGKICGLFTWLKMALFGLKMTRFYWLVFLFCSPIYVLQTGKVSTLLQYGYKCMKKMGATRAMIQIFQSVKICNIYVRACSCRAKFNLAVQENLVYTIFSSFRYLIFMTAYFDRYDHKKILLFLARFFWQGCEK